MHCEAKLKLDLTRLAQYSLLSLAWVGSICIQAKFKLHKAELSPNHLVYIHIPDRLPKRFHNCELEPSSGCKQVQNKVEAKCHPLFIFLL